MATMTEKQANYRTSLIEKNLVDAKRTYPIKNARGKAQVLVNVALLVSLPEPQTVAEASSQIDALKSDGIGLWASQQPNNDWAQDALAKLTAAWGADGAQWPVVDNRQFPGFDPDSSDLVAAVSAVL